MEAEKQFNDLLTEHENMIHYLIKKFGIRDPEKEFYQEGVIALWNAAETYDETRGKFSSYAYFRIEKALLSLIRKHNRQAEKETAYLTAVQAEPNQLTATLDIRFDPYLYDALLNILSINQRKWFTAFVLEDLPVKTIAERENVSVEAVKSWRKEAKRKIHKYVTKNKEVTLI